MSDRARVGTAVALLAIGLFGVLVGGGAYLQAAYEAWTFEHSGEADRM